MIKIDIKDGNMSIETDKEYTLPEITEVIFQAELYFMRKTEEHTPELKEEIFDMVNYKASALLENFAPDFELRPSLTEGSNYES